MNRPPPLGRIFAIYLRMLLIAALIVTTAALAIRLGWKPPQPVPGLTP